MSRIHQKRGLSEIIGALILLLAMSTLAVGFAKIMSKSMNGITSTEKDLISKLNEEVNRPTLSLSLVNGSLYLEVYPTRPFKLSKIIYQFYNGSIKVIGVEQTITKPKQFVLMKRYSCTKFRVFLITKNGVVYTYSPSRDPKFLSLDPELRRKAMTSQWISCELLNLLSDQRNASVNNEKGPIDPLTGSKLLDADPPIYLIKNNKSLGSLRLKLYFDGVISPTYTFMGITLNGKSYTNPLKCNGIMDLGYVTDHIKLLVGSYCVSGMSALYIYFMNDSENSNNFYVYGGNVSSSATITYSGDYWVHLSKSKWIGPLMLSEIDNFTLLVKGYEREYYSSNNYVVNLSGENKGSFLTTGCLMVLYSSIDYMMRVRYN
jgi:hypothetical protein